MLNIFVNLKRFEVSRRSGGVCGMDSPVTWIETTMSDCVARGLGASSTVELVFLLPEALIVPALACLGRHDPEQTRAIAVGCQGVHRDDIRLGGNFGAFTSGRPATAMTAIGCRWALIGHSEERRDLAGVFAAYTSALGGPSVSPEHAAEAAGRLLNQEVQRALEAGLDVLVCVGETAAERGEGDAEAQHRRVEAVLTRQVETILAGVPERAEGRRIVLAYEPVWAIGPGKVPPDADYIGFAAGVVGRAAATVLGQKTTVVYGGGLKQENAAAICAVPAVGGGLVALTRFTGEIGFYPDDLEKIVAAAGGAHTS